MILDYDNITRTYKCTLDDDWWKNTHNTDTIEVPHRKEITAIIHRNSLPTSVVL